MRILRKYLTVYMTARIGSASLSPLVTRLWRKIALKTRSPIIA